MLNGRNFDDVNLHDATIRVVHRTLNELTLLLDFAVVSDRVGGFTVLKDVRLVFFNVSDEESAVWYDDRTAQAHPQWEHPISEIMNNGLEDGRFHLDGFSEERDWSEWWIRADSFVLKASREERR